MRHDSNIVDRYENRVLQMYMQTHPTADINKVSMLIHQLTNERIKDIPCVMHNNITHETIDTTMLETFHWMQQRDPIITANGTFFMQHEEYLAPTVKMLEKLKANRKKAKKQMYSCAKGSSEYTNLNIRQLSIKVIMNADYGGSGTPLSPFYSCYIPPATTSSAKNMTTSLICCLELFSCNPDAWAKFYNINELYDFIFTVIDDDKSRDLISDKYSVQDVFEWLISRTNNVTRQDMIVLEMYLETLKPSELTKLMLAFNPRLVLTKYLTNSVGIVMNYLKQHQIDPDYVTEETINASGYGIKMPVEIESEVQAISKTIVDNCVYPFVPNDVEIRAENMTRLIVCVTDTDSLMVHFASFIDEFQARVDNFRSSCLIASALGMRIIVENVIPKMVEDIATFCNIKDKYYQDKFVFKNEFAFFAMALIAKKMYASSMFVQEGNPRNPHDIAVTGLSFKKRDAAEFLEPIMLRLYDEYILTKPNVDIKGILDEFYLLRNDLITKIHYDPTYHKMQTLKDISAYDPNKRLPAQMIGSIVWNNIMPDEEMLPMDRVIVIPLSFKLMHEHEMDHALIAEILRLSRIDNEKEKDDPYICLPEHYREIPEWIQPIIDREYAVDKLLMPFKQLLEAFDVFLADTKAASIPSRMVII